LIQRLRKKYPVYLLSGDSDRDKQQLAPFIDPGNQHYRCTPLDKKEFVQHCQADGMQVMMFGDGLNDAGALSESLVGVAVTADIHQFTPASDIIMESSQMERADDLIRYARFARQVIIWSFGISITYNIVGLFFALQGLLQPVIAAILMPLSTITIVIFTTGLSTIYARRLWKKSAFKNA
jgi:Cu+-exporting ATPase